MLLDEYLPLEQRDAVEVIAWLAEQPWCDGAVGMMGKSWGAYNSLQVAALRPPALKAIVPVMGTDDRWREDIHFYGGCLAGDNFWWGCIMQLYNARPPDPAVVGEDRWRAMWKERLEAMEFWPAMWARHQTHDATWRHGSICEDYDAVEVPVLFFGGWADLFRDTPFRIAEAMGDRTRVLMGPWAHLFPHEAVPGPRADFVGEAVRFLDRHLRGRNGGDEPRLRFYVQDGVPPSGAYEDRPGRWVEEPSWPSPNVADRAFWLNARALDGAPEAGENLTICSPQTYGQAAGDMCGFGIAGDLPLDGRIDAGGALLFRSAPLEEATDILRQPSLALTASADREWGFVAALLYDEAPDGAQSLISRGFCNLSHRRGGTDPTPVVPGEELDLTVPLHGAGCRVAAGHRLTLHVATAYWPVLWPAPAPVTLTIPPGRSRLVLPVRRPTPDAPAPPEPEPREAPRPVTTVREGSMERIVSLDAATGVVTNRVFLDGGAFGPVGDVRLDEIGTVLGHVSDRRYEIEADDPLSARATMHQTARFERDDWTARIETWGEMTATETEFRFRAWVRCWDGDALFHEVEWSQDVPRHGM